MNKWVGTAVCDGIAVGTAFIFRKPRKFYKKYAEDADAEREKFNRAKALVTDELEMLFAKTAAELGRKEAEIFSVHKMMLNDICYSDSVINNIEKQRVSAETAVLMTSGEFEKLFREMDSAYMRERAGDIRDVSERVISLLEGKTGVIPDNIKENTVIFAESLSPCEAVLLNKAGIAAFVTAKGSATTHTAILTRSLGIPSVAGIRINGSIDGRRVAVDGYTGTVYAEPDEKFTEALKKEGEDRQRKKAIFAAIKNKPIISRSGKRIFVLANTSDPNESRILRASCDGIGVFASESLYQKSKSFPEEGFQFDAYRKALEGMNGKPVTVKTLDLSAEKKADYFGIIGEKNPLMAMSSIRICLKYPELFKIQLRAIIKASVCGNVRILLPMISSVTEFSEAKKIISEVKTELDEQGVLYSEKIPAGIMIQTPASAIISKELAKAADFFCIDADALSQYMLAMDRKNPSLAEFLDFQSEPVLRMIRSVTENAHAEGIRVCITGEMAENTGTIKSLVRMGIDEFSVSAKKILPVKMAISEE